MQATMPIKKVLFIMLLLCWSQFAYALVAIPPISRVVDLTHTLTAQQITHLSEVLRQFETQKGAQIAVLIVNSTDPETIDQYGLRVAESWKLGRKKIDDGALLVVAMKDRAMRIEVGYGLEGALNDAICKRIISEVITPYFKQGQFFEGINQGVNQMIKTIQGEPLPPTNTWSFSKSAHFEIDFNTIFLVVFISMIASGFLKSIMGDSVKKRMSAATVIGLVAAVLVWLFTVSLLSSLLLGLLAFIFALLGYNNQGGGGSGYWGGGSGGSSGRGGGGFSGGGGSFGGGGSSGRW